MEKIKPIINRELNLTEYQYKGLLLEIATYLALKQLGIEPKPLHNPFDNEYAKDQHLKVDLIFIHEGKLFGIECKNLSVRSHVNMEFIKKEVVDRFTNTDLPFDKKLVVFGKCNYQDAIPEEYDVIELQYQVEYNNLEQSIAILSELLKSHLKAHNLCRVKPKLSSNSVTDCNSRVESLHGVNTYNNKRVQLQRIDAKLKKEWKRLILENRGVEILDSVDQLEGWIK